MHKMWKHSRVVKVHTFDLIYMAQIITIDESGALSFREVVSEKIVGPVQMMK